MRDLSGMRFGRWTVSDVGGRRRGITVWLCICACGNSRAVMAHHLIHGRSQSCGCLCRERVSASRTTHGQTRGNNWHPLYRRWYGMIERCTQPTHQSYPLYGGRGIRVCERWRRDFAAFLEDMGPAPSLRHTLDRINVNGDYEPGNVRWATWKEQAANKRPRTAA